ncbi:hypothetical protein PHMEG_00012411 [Phytophthora megakarya]|uniref:Integrase catalytic domain-containing protein n=1 Tax=Phytophthora megakarya TaxID=4795 RepID=A0A225W996_9STRA|nr:hypothetical protein PHMEG_00012411 [Phytophthora megakarya]
MGDIQKRTGGVSVNACSTRDPNELCEGCAQGEMTVASFQRNIRPNHIKSNAKQHLIHSDVAGPFKKSTPAERRYVVTFIDDFSCFVEVLEQINTIKAEVERQQSGYIRILRTDNGGIVHQKDVPYSPQQNGLAERMNRPLVEKARAMLHYNAVESRWWAETINCAAYLVNRLPAAAHKMTPYERWTGERQPGPSESIWLEWVRSNPESKALSA